MFCLNVLKVKFFHNCNRKDRKSWARMLRLFFKIFLFILFLHHLFNEFFFFLNKFTYPPQRQRTQRLRNHTTATHKKWNSLKPPIWRQPNSLLPSCSPFSQNKGELKFLPSSTPRIELVFGRFKDSPSRLGWEFIDTRFLLGTEASSSKLLPISGSAAQRTGCERHTAVKAVPGPHFLSQEAGLFLQN